MDTLTCPYCNATSPAEGWIIEGDVSYIAKAHGGEIKIEEDKYATHWYYLAICPRCQEQIEFPHYVHLEWWEPLEVLYCKAQKVLDLLAETQS